MPFVPDPLDPGGGYQPYPISPHDPTPGPPLGYDPTVPNPLFPPTAPPVTPDKPPALRWQDYLRDFLDLPQDLINQIEQIFLSNTDGNLAGRIALGVIRGSDWYKIRYRGIEIGIQKGLFGDEASYNAYVNSATVTFTRAYGRAPTQDEIVAFVNRGLNLGQIQQVGEGYAWQQANRPDVQYLFGAFGDVGGQLTEEQLQALGEQEVGLASGLGAGLQAKFNLALAKVKRVFEGTLATGGVTLGERGELISPGLGRQGRPDVPA